MGKNHGRKECLQEFVDALTTALDDAAKEFGTVQPEAIKVLKTLPGYRIYCEMGGIEFVDDEAHGVLVDALKEARETLATQ